MLVMSTTSMPAPMLSRRAAAGLPPPAVPGVCRTYTGKRHPLQSSWQWEPRHTTSALRDIQFVCSCTVIA